MKYQFQARFSSVIVILSMLLSALGTPLQSAEAAPQLADISQYRQSALVLVNSESTDYADFQHFIQPYLDHFGIPYSTLNISTTEISETVNEYALLVIGHGNLDSGTPRYLSTAEEGFISGAVNSGSGLVNFDNALSADGVAARYVFIDDVFGFGYNNDTSGFDVTFADPALNYIIARHSNGQSITTGTMSLAGITLPTSVTSLATSDTLTDEQPFVAVTTFGSGRGVQFGSYDWTSHSVKGPLWGLDDLFWRSMVWAARKPFAMQGLPPFITMRMDDVSGPLWWIDAANDYGFIPWAGVFTNDIDTAEATDLKTLVDTGKATTTIHAFESGTSRFFYYDHNYKTNYSDTVVADNFAEATLWFNSRNIPIGQYATPHYYEVGSNVFEELEIWGVKYLSTVMDPGQREDAAPWMMAGPFRLFETGNAYERNQNIYYSDYMTIPGRPELDNKFFNCITEIRDVTGYEWLGNGRTSVSVATADGIEWLKRPLDSMAIADLFSHEYTFISSMSEADWRTVLQGITTGIADYSPIFVSRDYACAYARAVHDSNITDSIYNAISNQITVDLAGKTDMGTKFYVFTEDAGQMVQRLVNVDAFSGTAHVNYTIPGALHHITVTPASSNIIAGTNQQFTAIGYDALDIPIPNLNFTWSVVGGGGTINGSGLFTAGVTPGTYTNTVQASFGSVQGHATVEVTETTLHHFSIDSIASPQYAGIPFNVTIRARDAGNNPVVTYNSTAALTASVGTIQPASVVFVNGVWTGPVTVSPTNTGVTITAQYLSTSGASNPFDVNPMRTCPCTIWEDSATPADINVSDGRPIEVGVKFRSDIDGYILGVRFYKGSSNTGSHTGHLWSSNGTKLAEATFANETASGWQNVYFSAPVQITANTTYVASYFSPTGYFSDTPDNLHAAVDNAPVHALAEGTDGPNGVYRYDTSGFPTSTWVDHAPNYWVDIIFDTSPGLYSIWDDSAVPANPAASDGNPIEPGIKFRSSQNGTITGLRFYKGTANTGVHVGHLWKTDQTMLAEATFTDETASGWQEVTLSTPVAITANTTYIASYYSPNGYFAIDSGYFVSAFDNPPLRALAHNEDGPNGVYHYYSSGYPDTSGEGSNYWVDVVFQPSPPPDTTPPTVQAVTPASGAANVSLGASVTATFNEAMDAATIITGTNFALRDASSVVVPATVSYDDVQRKATLVPSAPLVTSSIYTATIEGGAGGVADAAGNALAADYTWSFMTQGLPPDEGPGGPILVIADATSSNPFGRYYAEILRGEGFNAFFVTDISSVTSTTLASYDIVLLSEMALNSTQISMFDTWVNGGGNLIAFRPAKALATLYGLTEAIDTTSEGYLAVNTNTSIGQGIVADTMQFHGTADHYTLSSATSLAMLYTNATTPTVYPAIVRSSRGNGQVVIFTYDLARSIVLMRQGNPDWANEEGDGAADAIRATDLFRGRSGQPDWIDTSKLLIPQADEQMHVLSHAIEQLNATKRPLPRLWYFPDLDKGALIMTGDSEGCSGECVDIPMQHAKSYGGHYTAYLLGTQPTSTQVSGWLADGHGVAPHYNDTGEASAPTWIGMDAVYDNMTDTHVAAYGVAPRTVRNHWVLWLGWSEQAEIEEEHGIGLDTNYYHWGSWLSGPGYFTGSGLPLRFSDENGGILDVYQATTQLPDETWGQGIDDTFTTLIDRSIDQGYYGFLTANFHPPSYGSYQTVAGNMMAYANSRGVNIWSAEDLLNFLQARNQVRITGTTWNGTLLTFNVDQLLGGQHLTLMVPAQSGGDNLTSILLDGNPVTFTTQTIKGYNYALFPAVAGTYQADYADDTTAPAITNVEAVPAADGSATITWDTNELSDSLVENGTVSGVLGSSQSNAALVTSHSVTLTGLAPSTTYYYRVTSKDASNNSATSIEHSFTTPAQVMNDSSRADFGLALENSCYLAEAADGEVSLTPAIGAEFDGTALPSGWVDIPWTAYQPGGSSTVGSGLVSVDESLLATTSYYDSGHVLDFVATLQPNVLQHAGFAVDYDASANWAMFSAGSPAGSIIKARTNVGGSQTETDTTAAMGVPHHFRVVWTDTSVVYYIDDMSTPVATHAAAFGSTQLRPAISDLTTIGQPVDHTKALVVDWLHLSPYATPCSLTSRVFDAGEMVTWDTMSWTGTTPTGTSLGMSYRTGNTSNPDDGSWSAFVSVVSSPAGIGSSSRYIQYKADLATTNGQQTPVLEEVSFTNHSGVDNTPPVISNINHTVNNETSATVTWTTDEPSSSSVQYGISADTLNSSLSVGTLVTSHTINLGGFLPNTTYYYRVSSTDASTNTATSPEPPAAPLTFTTPVMPLGDDTEADFNAGTLSCSYVSATDDGELILLPTAGVEFDGTSLPSDWNVTNWNGNASYSVNNDVLTLDDAMVAYGPSTGSYGAGRSLEFVATISANNSQHLGFGTTLDGYPWAIFSTGFPGGTVLKARSWGTTQEETSLPGVALGIPHLFRIDWTSTTVTYYVDDVQVASHAVVIPVNMRPLVSDITNPGPNASLVVDWMRMSPFTGPCTFTSRVFDAGAPANWQALNWTAGTPAGTSLDFNYRVGNTPSPDLTWMSFIPVPTSGGLISGRGAYAQYQVTLSTTDPSITPDVQDVNFTYNTASDVTAPTIITHVPAVDAIDIAIDTAVTVTFSEPLDTGTVDGDSIYLRSLGDLTNIPTTVTLDGNVVRLTPNSLLEKGRTYTVTVKSTVADPAGNPLGTDATWNFTTLPDSVVDTTFADGSGSCVIDSTIGDGALRLPLTSDEGFSGSGLPTGWSSRPWTGGTSTVSNGLLAVDGASARNDALFGPGRSLEFVATFKAEAFQHIGFGGSDVTFNDAPIVMFSTREGTTTLYTSTFLGSYADVEIPNGSNLIGSPHRYRIDWKTDGFDFYVDGTLVSSRTSTVGTSMRVAASDFNLGNTSLTVDWMRLTPYLSPCTFESRVLDAGFPVNWLDLSWVGPSPTGTTLGFETRSGNTFTPDGNWSDWEAVNSPIASPHGRYIQYRATLGTTDPTQTPVIESVSLTYKALVTPTITWSSPADITYGTALGGSQLNATSIPGTFTYTPAAGTILNAGMHTLHVDFIPTDTETYTTASKDVTINVNKATAAITLGSLSYTYDGTPKSATASTDPAGLTVGFTYDGSTTAPTNAGTYAVSATIDDANYEGTASGILVIAKAIASITLGGLSHTYDGTAKSASATTNPTGLTVTFTYNGSSVDPTNANTYAVIATIDDANYEGTASGTLVIAKAIAAVMLSGLSHTYDGTAKSASVTTTPPGLAVDVTYDELPTLPIALGDYAVVATVTDPNYSGSASGTLVIEQATASHSLTLVPGWNLVSFNVEPTSTAIGTVLAGLDNNYDLVYAWNAGVTSNNWLKYSPTAPSYSNTLDDLNEKMGFWIHMTAADTLDVTGKVPVNTEISLSTSGGGWNLVAYPSGVNRPLPVALSNNGVGSDFTIVYTYQANGSPDPWKLFDRTSPAWSNDLTELSPGWGYWIKVSVNHTWNVNYLLQAGE